MQEQVKDRTKQFQNMVQHLADVDPKVVALEEKLADTSPYRQHFHVEPHSGILNDPNGFAYFDGEYHLFYQWTPLAFTQNPRIWHHGWYHLASKDLIHWEDRGPAIESDTCYDKHGTYSGSGLAVGNKLFLMYTGNTWDKYWHRVPYQMGAWMDTNGHITKLPTPFITGQPSGYTPHFRDPKVWKQDGHYYTILGIQRENLTGASVIYMSDDLSRWQLLGEVKTQTSHFGYMWECPDYFEVDGDGVLLFSPQGLKPEGDKYHNIYQTGCYVGNPMNMDTLNFEHGDFQELDAGFDFYATQTMATPDGRRILTAWFGISELHYPTEQYHYTGSLVLPRELFVKNGRLIQKPIREVQSLRRDQQSFTLHATEEPSELRQATVQEVKAKIDMRKAQRLVIDLRANADNSKHTRLLIDKQSQSISLDRGDSGIELAEEYGTTRRRALLIRDRVTLDIFIDVSSVEIFVNDGQMVFSARIFPETDQTYTFITSEGGTTQLQGDSWLL